jgi:hypothetical protein
VGGKSPSGPAGITTAHVEKRENDIIAAEELQLPARFALWPLSGLMDNRNAYRKPVE